MRTLRDLDDEIARAERRLAARRKHLTTTLAVSRSRTRVSLASPKVLAAAFAAGFLLDRLGRVRRHGGRAQQRSASSGIIAALAAAAVRAVLGNPKVWSTLRDMWARRTAGGSYEPLHPPAARDYPAALERAPYKDLEPKLGVDASRPAGAAVSRAGASSYGVAATDR
jgi:hypothetical protein